VRKEKKIEKKRTEVPGLTKKSTIQKGGGSVFHPRSEEGRELNLRKCARNKGRVVSSRESKLKTIF